jgi:MFS superfamily sulfate permease-like transporter
VRTPRRHGLFWAGLIQVALAVAGVAELMRFIPRSVMVGFVMIGQTMINVKVSGARTRLSTFLAPRHPARAGQRG